MREKSLAISKLNQAIFFKNCASQAIASEKREAFLDFFEAAIVFARSVTFFLQKEYRHVNGFDDWYFKKRGIMKQDPIFSFFLTKRNIILKQGSAEVFRIVKISGKASINFSGYSELKVIRKNPWYCRSPKILWDDFCMEIKQLMRRLIWLCKLKLKKLLIKNIHRAKKTKTKITEKEFFFSDSEWKNRPAFILLQEYLNKLEKIVLEAEKKFKKLLTIEMRK